MVHSKIKKLWFSIKLDDNTYSSHWLLSLQDCGIESLVEELCVKLKRVKEERDRGTKDGVGSSEDDPSSSMKPTTKLARQENPATQAAK